MIINGNIIDWLSESGVPIYDTTAGEVFDNEDVKFPFAVLTDIKNYDGADERNLYIRHSVYVYFYTENGADDTLENYLNSQNVKFSCDKTYLEADNCFEVEIVINEEIFTKIKEE